jgi:hypothetical protein
MLSPEALMLDFIPSFDSKDIKICLFLMIAIC